MLPTHELLAHALVYTVAACQDYTSCIINIYKDMLPVQCMTHCEWQSDLDMCGAFMCFDNCGITLGK